MRTGGRQQNEYPYFEVRRWEGRLPTPLEYRGTSIAKQFESGRIGGKKVAETQQFSDSEEGRRVLREWYVRHQHQSTEVYWIRSRDHSRIAVHGGEILKHGFVTEGIRR